MKIVILEGLAVNPGDLSWDSLRQFGELTVYQQTTPEEAVERIGDAEIVLINKLPVTASLLDACPSIKLVGVLATGYNVVDVNAAKEKGIMSVPAAVRIYNLKDEPDERDLHITALAVGDAVIAGFPGEPFTEIGRSVKKHSPFTVTLTACAANSYEDYFPMQDCFDEGGYETESTLYAAGTAERMIEASLDLINTLI